MLIIYTHTALPVSEWRFRHQLWLRLVFLSKLVIGILILLKLNISMCKTKKALQLQLSSKHVKQNSDTEKLVWGSGSGNFFKATLTSMCYRDFDLCFARNGLVYDEKDGWHNLDSELIVMHQNVKMSKYQFELGSSFGLSMISRYKTRFCIDQRYNMTKCPP